jgi:2-oxo-4-hydroxy-4-carboxy--5-ureidoimidazoline (OHCU) decarboxylase
MTLTIDVPADVERALAERARRTGRSVAEVAAALLAEAARTIRETALEAEQPEIAVRLAALARIGAYDTRARAGLPPLSDEAISRESMYEGRGQ